jgi:hypothetical protein
MKISTILHESEQAKLYVYVGQPGRQLIEATENPNPRVLSTMLDMLRRCALR